MKRIILFLVCAVFVQIAVWADDDKPIKVAQLPDSAKQFIEKYFSGLSVSYAKMESDLFDKSYEVIFVNGSKVEFNKKGDWKDIDCKFTKMPDGIVPAPIQDYITGNYKDLNIVEIDRDNRDYEVKLSDGLELTFDLHFNLIEIDQ